MESSSPMQHAPIAFFVYRRLAHTRRTVEALLRNTLAPVSDLHVFSDGPRSEAEAEQVAEVRSYVSQIRGFRSLHLHFRSENAGLSRSIIEGVTWLCEQAGRVVVLEDDLVTSPYFLQYLNEGLEMYEAQPEVASIHAYIYPIRSRLPRTFFIRGADCWGWATWRRGWAGFRPDGAALLAELEGRGMTQDFDFNGTYAFTPMLRDQIEGRNDSWAIRWYASAFLQNQVTLYPGKSLVQNIGHDGTGRHCGPSQSYDVPLSHRPVLLERLAPVEDLRCRQAMERYFYRMDHPSLGMRLRRKMRRVLSGVG